EDPQVDPGTGTGDGVGIDPVRGAVGALQQAQDVLDHLGVGGGLGAGLTGQVGGQGQAGGVGQSLERRALGDQQPFGGPVGPSASGSHLVGVATLGPVALAQGFA